MQQFLEQNTWLSSSGAVVWCKNLKNCIGFCVFMRGLNSLCVHSHGPTLLTFQIFVLALSDRVHWYLHTNSAQKHFSCIQILPQWNTIEQNAYHPPRHIMKQFTKNNSNADKFWGNSSERRKLILEGVWTFAVMWHSINNFHHVFDAQRLKATWNGTKCLGKKEWRPCTQTTHMSREWFLHGFNKTLENCQGFHSIFAATCS